MSVVIVGVSADALVVVVAGAVVVAAASVVVAAPVVVAASVEVVASVDALVVSVLIEGALVVSAEVEEVVGRGDERVKRRERIPVRERTRRHHTKEQQRHERRRQLGKPELPGLARSILHCVPLLIAAVFIALAAHTTPTCHC